MRLVRTLAALGLAVAALPASEQRGQVKFGGLPVPGATVTAAQSGKKLSAITDSQGNYSFADLADGLWTIQVEMQGFATLQQDVTVSRGAPASEWNLRMLPLGQMGAVAAQAPAPTPAVVAVKPEGKSRKRNAPPAPANTPGAFQRTDVNAANASAAPGGDATQSNNSGASSSQSPEDLSQRASDGLLINGTANNGASSPFAQAQAFGNNRRGTHALYSGNLGLIFDTSVLDARPFSITGQDTQKLPYQHLHGVFAFGGPFKIPHLVSNGGNFFINYQRMRNRQIATAPMAGLMPTADERMGDFSHTLNALGHPVQLIDPSTGAPIPGNKIPDSKISPQAKALLPFFPLPNFDGGTRFNYQIPLLGNMHDDALQGRYNKTIGRKNFISGLFAMDSTRLDGPNIFQFLDTRSSLGLNAAANFRHNFTPRFFTNIGGQYSRFAARVTPFFANLDNVSQKAGITGNNQAPLNWGPPTLNFASGITSLSDGLYSHNRSQTVALTVDNLWARARHNISFGGDVRRQEYNIFSQQDPRGSFTFTGAAAGSDFAGFLLGVPDTSSIAFGNADKYLRASTIEAYVNDDWRMSPGFTLNAGVRWEYWSPITEKYGRLVNLDVAPGFSAVTPVLASDPAGPLTNQTFPDSLMKPYKGGVQPRLALSWRPFAASSMVVRAGYGVYFNTSVYYPIATLLDQQPPLSKSLNVSNGPADPLTLANGFKGSPEITPNTVAVDPKFRPGYSQNWQISVQRDMPAALVLTVLYLGSKGTHEVQDFLPNSYPLGAANPCPACPSGFQYLVSNGNSTREAGQIQLRRRLERGFTASLQYTYAKAIDDAALGGRNQGTPVVAQNWLDLDAERGLSTFDQRHQLTTQIQYTTGMGLRGGALVNGWKGALFKEWTLMSQITAASGLPLTPLYPFPVPGTGVTGPLRPDYTGAPLYAAPAGLFLNPAAFALPPAGQWGNAGRDSITGPSQFSLNASLGRIFQLSDRFSLDFRVDATNALNHVTFPNWNTTITNAQFGLPVAANAMRSMQTTIRLRF